MIGALAARPRVLRLDCFDQTARKLEVVDPGDPGKVGRVEPRRSGPFASAPYIARELAEAFVRCRIALMPNDHRPAKRFTARRTSTTESMSSRFSRR
jgi:hypothetical protein